ncbi:MAG: alpha/beta hydrolase [Christiangramia sp.]|nr:esterase [Christiangramia sp.]
MKRILLLMLLVSSFAVAQDLELALWPDEIPNSRPSDEKEIQEKNGILWIRQVQNPGIEVYLPVPQIATGQAVLICPGGGYQGLAFDWEGRQIAKWLNSKGIAGIVLKYRLPNSRSIETSYKAPLQDARRAMRLIRSRAEEWKLDENKIGVMGFSAGGHLASTLGTHLEMEENLREDEINKLKAKPDFMVLVYPVITMNSEYTHQGSRNSLLGQNPGEELVKKFSNELQVTSETPPTFLVATSDDEVVPVQNSLHFYESLVNSKVPAEMHIYPKGGHGFAFGTGQYYLQDWNEILASWLQNLQE